jgi:hypothetical protein
LFRGQTGQIYLATVLRFSMQFSGHV